MVDYSPIKLDLKDRRILLALAENSRTGASEIAKQIGVSREKTSYKLARLERLGVITRKYPKINLEMLGLSTFSIFLLVDTKSQSRIKDLIAFLTSHPKVRQIVEYTAEWDFEIEVICEGIHDFERFMSEDLAVFKDIIIDQIRQANVKNYYSIPFPFSFHKDVANIRMPPLRSQDIKIDSIDRQILYRLGEDARASTYDLAKSIQLSPEAIGLRIRRLYAAGMIKQYAIHTDMRLLGFQIYTFAVLLRYLDVHTEAKLKTFIEQHANIVKASLMFGHYDLLIYIIGAEHEFHETVKSIKLEFGNIIRSYYSFLQYKEHYFCPTPKTILIDGPNDKSKARTARLAGRKA